MIQFFWMIDFVGIFLSRLIVSIIFFNFFLKSIKEDKNKIISIIYLISSIWLFLGLFTSFISIVWILSLFFKMFINKKIDWLFLSLIPYFLILLFVGPGKLSLDRIFELRYF